MMGVSGRCRLPSQKLQFHMPAKNCSIRGPRARDAEPPRPPVARSKPIVQANCKTLIPKRATMLWKLISAQPKRHGCKGWGIYDSDTGARRI